MFSETKRKLGNRRLVNTIRSRRGDKSKDHPTPFISIQQRLHVDDASGSMLSSGPGVQFHHVVIPALVCEEYVQSLQALYRSMCWDTVTHTDAPAVRGPGFRSDR